MKRFLEFLLIGLFTIIVAFGVAGLAWLFILFFLG